MNQQSIVVLKFGSSILANTACVSQAVHAVYKHLRQGKKVLAIVSALGNTTDDLLAASQAVLNDSHAEPHPEYLAELLATGETASTALFCLALDNAGIPVTKLDHTCITTEGSLLDSTPQRLNTALIHALFKQSAVVVLPGFIGQNATKQLTLLGRGGSDFTAVFAGYSLAADECILYKDTAGIYNDDPNENANAKLYKNISYQDANQLDYPVVQYKTLQFAEEKNFKFRVQSLEHLEGTLVGPEPSQFYQQTQSLPRLRVILFGLGTVGLGVYKHLTHEHSHFEVVGIGVKNIAKYQHLNLPHNLLLDDIDALLKREYDVAIELIGGIETANKIIKTALENKKHVITANKALLAEQGEYLNQLATQNNVKLLFSAAVAGSVPLLEKITSLQKQQAQIKSITGILNGTCNYILDKIRSGSDWQSAVVSAQQAGFAEADPSLDVNGTDAAQKLRIIARLAFGAEPQHIEVEGIQHIDENHVRDASTVVRLVGHCELKDNVLKASLKPTALALDHPLAHIQASNNGVLIETHDQVIKIHGKGAGRWPTAVAVHADLLELRQSCGGL